MDVLMSGIASKFRTREVSFDETPNLLFQLERELSSMPEAEVGKIQGNVEKLLLATVLPRCGSTMLRRTVANCMVLMFVRGNIRSMSSTYSTLMDRFHEKELDARLCALCCFGVLSERFGQQFIENSTDVISIFSKLCKGKDKEEAMKEAVMVATRRLYQGNGGPMSGDHASNDAAKMISKCATDRSESVQLAVVEAMRAVVKDSTECHELDQFVPACTKAMQKCTNLNVKREFSLLLGVMLAMVHQKERKNAAKRKKQSAVKRVIKQKKELSITNLDDAIHCIEALFAKAGSQQMRGCLAHSTVALLRASHVCINEETLSKYMSMMFSFIQKGKPVATPQDGFHSARCLSLVIRQGLLDLMPELALGNAGETMTQMIVTSSLPQSPLNEFQLSVCLDQMCWISLRLGSALETMDIKDKAFESLRPLLSSPKTWIRVHAAECFRQLCSAASSQITTWLSVLYKDVEFGLSEVSTTSGTVQASSLQSLHGTISALAAIVSVVPTIPEGVPLNLLEGTFEAALTCASLRLKDTAHPAYEERHKLKMGGWTLIAALMALGSEWCSTKLPNLLKLWANVLGRPAPTTPPFLVAMDFKMRQHALRALRAMIEVCKAKIAPEMAKQIVLLLPACFEAISRKDISTSSHDPAQVMLAESCVEMTSVLMDVYALLPALEKCERKKEADRKRRKLMEFVVKIMTQETHSTSEVHKLLSPVDDPLGNRGGQVGVCFAELLETNQSTCEPDYTWNWCVRFMPRLFLDNGDSEMFSAHNNQKETEGDAHGRETMHTNSEECTQSPQLRKINACIRTFAALFPVLDDKSPLKVAEHFLKIINHKQANNRNSSNDTISTNVSTALLALCRELSRLDKSGQINVLSTDTMKVLAKACFQLMSSSLPSVRRAVGESLGILCSLEDRRESMERRRTSSMRGASPRSKESFTDYVRKECHAKLNSRPSSTGEIHSRSSSTLGAAFSLGCIHRYVGMRSMGFQQETIMDVQRIRGNTRSTILWVMHSLWLASRGDFHAKAVDVVLDLLYEQAVVDRTAPDPSSTQVLLRIINSLVATMQPELTHPTKHNGVQKYLDLWTYLKQESYAPVQVEVMYFLFSLLTSPVEKGLQKPGTIWFATVVKPATMHRLLNAGMASEDVNLRRSTINCMRGWAEKDPSVIFAKDWDRTLLTMLDHEVDPGVSHHIMEIFEAFLDFLVLPDDPFKAPGGESCVWRLLDICKRAVIDGHRLPSDTVFTKEKINERKTQDDDGLDSVIQIESSKKKNTDTRAFTKVFGLECIDKIIQRAREIGHKAHFDLQQATDLANGKPMFIAQQVTDLVTVTARSVSSYHEPLRIKGCEVLQHVIEYFEDSMDPDAPDPIDYPQLLLQTREAEISAVLRQALSLKSDGMVSGPLLRQAACNLASTYLNSGILQDSVGISRILGLLTFPLLNTEELKPWLSTFSGKVQPQVILAHLAAVAKVDLAAEREAAAAALLKKKKKKKKKAKQPPKHPRSNTLSMMRSELLKCRDKLVQLLFSSLRDCLRVNFIPESHLSKVNGHIFDGKQTTGAKQVFIPARKMLIEACSHRLSQLPDSLGEEMTRADCCLDLLACTLSALESATNPQAASRLSPAQRAEVVACYDALDLLLQPDTLAASRLPPTMQLEMFPFIDWALRSKSTDPVFYPAAFRALESFTNYLLTAELEIGPYERETMEQHVVDSIEGLILMQLPDRMGDLTERGIDAVEKALNLVCKICNSSENSEHDQRRIATHLPAAVSSCIHIMHTFQAGVTAIAFQALYRLVSPNIAAQEGYPTHPLESTSASLANDLNEVLQGKVDKSIRGLSHLLGAMLQLGRLQNNVPVFESSPDKPSDAGARSRAVAVIKGFLEHDRLDFRLAALGAVKGMLDMVTDAKPKRMIIPGDAEFFVVSFVTPVLVAMVHSSDSMAEERALAIACVMLILGCIDEPVVVEKLVCLFTPLMMMQLDQQPAVLDTIMEIAQRFPAVFKAQAALLPESLRQNFAGHVRNKQLTKQEEMAQGGQSSADDDVKSKKEKKTKKDGKSKKEKKKKKKKKGRTQDEGANPADIDFSKFGS